MLSNSQVAEAFVAGKKGKSKNMFIKGDTIYSYGTHFPIAKRLNNKEYLFNSNEYSITTAMHKAHVQWALRDCIVYKCPNCDPSELAPFIKENINTLIRKIAKSYKRTSRYISEIMQLSMQWQKAKNRFSLEDDDIDFLISYMQKGDAKEQAKSLYKTIIIRKKFSNLAEQRR